MKVLKELFSFDEYDDDEMKGGNNEFDFDFDFENPDALNFDDDTAMDPEMGMDYDGDDMMGMEDEYPEDMDAMGAEEDYPEGMDDMPDSMDVEDELADISDKIETLYSRLGKLAAAGDLNLYDGGMDGMGGMGDYPEDDMMGMDGSMEDEPMPDDMMGMDPEMGMEDDMMGMDPSLDSDEMMGMDPEEMGSDDPMARRGRMGGM